MSIAYDNGQVVAHHGDCLDVLAEMPDMSIDAIVTDPPYGLGFMGKEWDDLPPGLPWARECLRVLKPGGHLLAFGGTRTWHRLACAVEDAGFEVRDSIAWLYGSGFPKSLDVSKAIDKRPGVMRHAEFARHLTEKREAAGLTPADVSEAVVGTRTGACWNWEHHQLPEAKWWPALRDLLDLDDATWGPVIAEAERAKVGTRTGNRLAVAPGQGMDRSAIDLDVTTHATPAAERWQGWGTALKPSHEPVVCARKPFNAVPLGEEVDRLHHLIGGLLWLSLSPARRAQLTSPSSPAGQHETTCVSALVSAALNTSPDASDETATFSSPALASTSSNIASSWSATLGALSARTRTSTTSTASSTTTALRTLNSLLGPITSQTTMPRCGCLVDGPSSPAPSAASSSSDEWAKWLHTLSASVPATATEGIAFAVASALASIAADLSGDQAAASSADPTATTGAAARGSALEPIVVARKPLAASTVAANVLAHGTGALNIDACRVPLSGDARPRPRGGGGSFQFDGFSTLAELESAAAIGGTTPTGRNAAATLARFRKFRDTERPRIETAGRWPANVVLDESQAAALDEQSGESVSKRSAGCNGSGGAVATFGLNRTEDAERGHDDAGGASRFFPTFRYEAKAPQSERPRDGATAHPTVKPLDLMRWLVRLVTPPCGTVLDPFLGSGTTAEACVLEGFRCVGIEREADYIPLIVNRLNRRLNPAAYLAGNRDDDDPDDLLSLLDGGAA